LYHHAFPPAKRRSRPYDFESPDEETVILGHSGFLDYFTATFDGEIAELILVANRGIPHG
jgi:hypothetical protein